LSEYQQRVKFEPEPTYPRLILRDTFSNPILKPVLTSGNVSLSTDYVYRGARSLKLASNPDLSSMIEYWIAQRLNKRIGFEVIFGTMGLGGNVQDIIFYIMFDTVTKQYEAIVTYDYSTATFRIQALTGSAIILSLPYGLPLGWDRLKFVADFDAKKYVKFEFADYQIPLENYQLFEVTGTMSLLRFGIRIDYLNNYTPSPLYLSEVTLTHYEP